MRWPEALLPSQAEALGALLVALPDEPPPLLLGAAALRARLPPDERLQHSRDVDVAVLAAAWPRLERDLRDLRGFTARIEDLRVTHDATGAILDVVPYGPIESNTGLVENPVSGRRIVTLGLPEARDAGDVVVHGARRLVIPTREHLVAIKAIAWADRRAPHDVEDIGRLLRSLPADDASVEADEPLWTALAEGAVVYDDLAVWQAGRRLRATCRAATLAHLIGVFDLLLGAPLALRRRLVRATGDLDADVALAERKLLALKHALSP